MDCCVSFMTSHYSYDFEETLGFLTYNFLLNRYAIILLATCTHSRDYEVTVWPKHAIATEYKPVILRCTVVYYKEMYTEPLIWLQNSREYFSVGEAGHNFITKGICGHWGWSQPGMTRALVIRTRLAASIIRFLFQWI